MYVRIYYTDNKNIFAIMFFDEEHNELLTIGAVPPVYVGNINITEKSMYDFIEFLQN